MAQTSQNIRSIQIQHNRHEREKVSMKANQNQKKKLNDKNTNRFIQLLQQDEFERLRVAEIVCAVVALTSILGSLVAQDILFTEESLNKDGWDYIKLLVESYLLVCQTLQTILLETMIVWKTYRKLQWHKSKGEFSSQDNIYTSGLYKLMTFEIFINLFHPIQPFQEKKFVNYNSMLGTEIQYRYNEPLAIMVLIRLYHLFVVSLQISKYSSIRAQRVCDMNSHNSSAMFTLRCLMVDLPSKIILTLMCATILVFGYILHICERSHWNIPDSDSGKDFGNWSNSMWCVIVTITTVGYGDFYPLTNAGRFIAFIVCLWGVILVSLMVVSVTNTLEMNASERRTYYILQRLDFRNIMKQQASVLISLAAKIKLLMRKRADRKEIARYIGIFIKAKAEFKKQKKHLRALYMQGDSQNVTGNDLSAIRFNIEFLKQNIQDQVFDIQKQLQIIIGEKQKKENKKEYRKIVQLVTEKLVEEQEF